MTYMSAWMSLKFGKIRLRVSMATDRVIMEKNSVTTFSRLFLSDPFQFSYFQVMMTCMRAWRSSKFSEIRQLTAELAALERLKNPHRRIMGKMVLPQFLDCS